MWEEEEETKDQTESESRVKENQGRLEGKLRDCGYVSVPTNTELYLPVIPLSMSSVVKSGIFKSDFLFFF